MKQKKLRRIFSGMLAAAILFTAMPTTAKAENAVTAIEASEITEDETAVVHESVEEIEDETVTSEEEITVDLLEQATDNTEAVEETDLEVTAFAKSETAKAEEAACVYAVMNVPYQAFYATVLGQTNETAVDVVSQATTNKSRGIPNTYYNGTDPTMEKGTDILGIRIPVQMTEEIYNAILAKGLTENEDYYVGETLEAPKVYLPVEAYVDGKVTFGSLQGKVKVTEQVNATITSSTNYGDYQINLTDSSMGMAASTVYGVYLTAEDGSQYAMRQLENLWTLSNIYQFAWSTGVKTKEPHGGILSYNHTRATEGKNITGVTYITSKGIIQYRFTEALHVSKHYTEGTIQAEIMDLFHVKVTGIPDNAENVTVNIYYAQGRTRVAAVTGATVGEDGTVKLTSGLVAGKTYTVSVNTTNYAVMTGSFVPEKEKFASEYYFVTNIPYDEFYQAVGIQNETSVDIVSSATTNKSRRDTKVYYESEKTTITGGTDVLGIKLPVKMSYDTYAAKFATVTDPEAAYYVGETMEAPATYFTYDGNSYALVAGETKVEKDVAATINSATNWGDYEIDIDRNHKSGYTYEGRNGTQDAIGMLPADVYGVYLTATDGTQYAMKQTENLWTLSDYYEFAWSTGVKVKEPHGGIYYPGHYQSMEGKSILSVTYITVRGLETYEFQNALYVAPHIDFEVVANLTSTVMDKETISTLQFAKLPTQFENAKVSVYSVSGRTRNYLVENAPLAKEIACTVAAENGVEYTLTITSDNYANHNQTISLGSYIKAISDQVYTGAQVKPALLVYNNGNLLTEKTDYTVAYKNNINLTTETKKAEAVVTFKGNYSGKLTANFQIVAKDITGEATAADLYVKASTKNIKVSPVVMLGKKKLALKKEYSLSTDVVPGTAGTTEITITGVGNYTGSIVCRVHVVGNTKGLIDIAKVKYNKIPAQTYTGKAVKLSDEALVLTYHKKTVDPDCYTVTYLNNTELGTATAIIVGNEEEGYTGYVTKTFSIVATPITNYKITPSASTIVYGDTYSITVGEGRSVLREGTHYTVDRSALNKVGTGYVLVKGIGLYTGTAKVKVTVTKATLTEEMIHVAENAVYNPKGAKAQVTVSYNDITLVEGKDYTLTYSNHKALSTETKQASVVIKAKGNFSAPAKGFAKNYKVVARDLEKAQITTEDLVATSPLSKTKVTVVDENGNKLPAKAFTLVYTVNGEAVNGAQKLPAGTKVFVSAKAVEGQGYSGQTKAVPFTVYASANKLSAAKITVSKKLYQGTEITLEQEDFTATIGKKPAQKTLLLGRDFEIVSYQNNTKAGTAKVVLRGIGNYGGTKTVTFQITARAAK